MTTNTDKLAAQAKECGATVYAHRTSPHEPAVAFSPSAWEAFCARALAAIPEPTMTLDGLTPAQFALRELYEFQEATGCDTAQQFKDMRWDVLRDRMLAAAPTAQEAGKPEQAEAPSDLSVLHRIRKLLVNQVRPALRSPVITKDVDYAVEAVSALMSRAQAESTSDSTLKLAEMILADCGHSTAISTRLRDRVAERIERHLTARPTDASCRYANADGHALMPFEPTDAMEVAAENAYEDSGSTFPNWKTAYRAMRDAALATQPPAIPAAPAVQDSGERDSMLQAWSDCKSACDPSNWSTSEAAAYRGFFVHGYRAALASPPASGEKQE